jgi:hypothetical protein
MNPLDIRRLCPFCKRYAQVAEMQRLARTSTMYRCKDEGGCAQRAPQPERSLTTIITQVSQVFSNAGAAQLALL